MQKSGISASTVALNLNQSQPKGKIPHIYYSNTNARSSVSLLPEGENSENDWIYSKIFALVSAGNFEFNSENYSGVFYEAEIPYIETMLKDKKQGSKIFEPFLVKAKNTLRKLAEEFNRPAIFESFKQEFPSVMSIILMIFLRNHRNQH